MTKEQMSELVGIISDKVYGEGDYGRNGCSPVELRIGFVNNVVIHDGIVILNAPPVITELVADWIDKQNEQASASAVSASAGFGGLLVR